MLTGEAAQGGVAAVLPVHGDGILQLGVINLLPIPVLDGGHIFILVIEGLMRRDFSMKMKERVMQFGFIVLLLIMGGVIFLDIDKMGFFKSLSVSRTSGATRRGRSSRRDCSASDFRVYFVWMRSDSLEQLDDAALPAPAESSFRVLPVCLLVLAAALPAAAAARRRRGILVKPRAGATTGPALAARVARRARGRAKAVWKSAARRGSRSPFSR